MEAVLQGSSCRWWGQRAAPLSDLPLQLLWLLLLLQVLLCFLLLILLQLLLLHFMPMAQRSQLLHVVRAIAFGLPHPSSA